MGSHSQAMSGRWLCFFLALSAACATDASEQTTGSGSAAIVVDGPGHMRVKLTPADDDADAFKKSLALIQEAREKERSEIEATIAAEKQRLLHAALASVLGTHGCAQVG